VANRLVSSAGRLINPPILCIATLRNAVLAAAHIALLVTPQIFRGLYFSSHAASTLLFVQAEFGHHTTAHE
jgi:hypothetical protein